MGTSAKKIIQIDEELFEHYGIRLESISYIFDEDGIKIYAEILSVGSNEIDYDLTVIVGFYTDCGLEYTMDCYIRKEDFFKCKILRENNYFNDRNYLDSLKSRINKVCAFVEKG